MIAKLEFLSYLTVLFMYSFYNNYSNKNIIFLNETRGKLHYLIPTWHNLKTVQAN